MRRNIQIILVIILVSLSLFGCKSKGNKVSMFCSECLNESTVSRYCPECGVEAKWLIEKPSESKNEEEARKQEIEKQELCMGCGDYKVISDFIKLEYATLCSDCYDSYSKDPTCKNGWYSICVGCEECEIKSTYQPNDYDMYYPEGSLEEMYTCATCGKTSNLSMGTIGICNVCLD